MHRSCLMVRFGKRIFEYFNGSKHLYCSICFNWWSFQFWQTCDKEMFAKILIDFPFTEFMLSAQYLNHKLHGYRHYYFKMSVSMLTIRILCCVQKPHAACGVRISGGVPEIFRFSPIACFFFSIQELDISVWEGPLKFVLNFEHCVVVVVTQCMWKFIYNSVYGI